MLQSKNNQYMTIALAEVGQEEVAGAASNPRIVEYHQSTTLKATDDDVPWCAAFVNWVLLKAGLPFTKSAAALSFLDWGIKVKTPKYGDLVVFDYGHGRGHVGFYVGERDGKISVLGGNQDNSVNVKQFTLSSYDIEYRRLKTIGDSTTVVAASTVAVVQAGSLATSFTDKVGEAANKVTEVAATAANVQPDQMAGQLHDITNFLFLFVPPEYQPVVQAAVTLLGVAWVIRERTLKLRKGV